jgi:hypothetical protein
MNKTTPASRRKTNRGRAAKILAGSVSALTYESALALIDRAVPENTPVPDVTDPAVVQQLLGTGKADETPAAGYAYLSCPDGYSLNVNATDGTVTVHDLGSTEDENEDGERLDLEQALPDTVTTGDLYLWFVPETFAAEGYVAGDNVTVVSYDWSLLKADMNSRHADSDHLTRRAGDVLDDLHLLAGPAPSCYASLLADAVDAFEYMADQAGNGKAREAAQDCLNKLRALAA